MLGIAQMASAEVEHQDPESRTQAGAELEPRAFAQLQPVAQTFRRFNAGPYAQIFSNQGF